MARLFSIALICGPLVWASASATSTADEVLPELHAATDVPRASVKLSARADDSRADRPFDPESDDVGVLRERYPDGTLKSEWRFSLDDADIETRVGERTRWSSDGKLLWRGQYRGRHRHGPWSRWIDPDESSFVGPLDEKFEAPFVSAVTIKDGQIQDYWVLRDAAGRTISECEITDGQVHGRATWWYTNGRKAQEADYARGILDGEYRRWSRGGELLESKTFRDNLESAVEYKYHPSGDVKAKKHFVFTLTPARTTFDWNNGILHLALAESKRVKQKHDIWTTWHARGTKKNERNYYADVATGTYTSWYETGQIRVQGPFVNGRRDGSWSWWHANGLRKTRGSYTADQPTGVWFAWNDEGRVVVNLDYGNAPVMPADDADESTGPLFLGELPDVD